MTYNSWQTKKLGEVCEISAGNSAPQKRELFLGGRYPFFRTSDVGEIHIGILATSKDYLNDNGIKRLRLYKKGTLLFPKSGASTYLDHRVLMGVDGYVSSHLATIYPRQNILNEKFLFYFSIRVRAKDLIQKKNYPSLRLADISNIKISLPPLPEQKRIVKKLDEIFEKIEKVKSNAQKNLENVRELFQSYLQNAFTNQKNNWQTKKLGEVCETSSGGTPLKSFREYYKNGDIPWLRSGEICKKDITKAEAFITKEGLSNSSAKIFPQSTVLVAMYGATAGQVGILRFESATNQAVCGILPNKKILPEFLYYFFIHTKDELVKKATGNAQPNISQIKIKNVEIPFLSLLEQKRIVKRLDFLAEKTKRLEKIYQKKLDNLEELEKAVLQKAFRGEL